MRTHFHASDACASNACEYASDIVFPEAHPVLDRSAAIERLRERVKCSGFKSDDSHRIAGGHTITVYAKDAAELVDAILGGTQQP